MNPIKQYLQQREEEFEKEFTKVPSNKTRSGFSLDCDFEYAKSFNSESSQLLLEKVLEVVGEHYYTEDTFESGVVEERSRIRTAILEALNKTK